MRDICTRNRHGETQLKVRTGVSNLCQHRSPRLAHTSQGAHEAGAYPSFRSMKRLGAFQTPPPPPPPHTHTHTHTHPALNVPVTIYNTCMGVEKHCGDTVSCPRT